MSTGRAVLLLGCSFFFKQAPTTKIYTLPLHGALPIFVGLAELSASVVRARLLEAHARFCETDTRALHEPVRSEEHTSELQSRQYLVCRLLLEKKKITHPAAVPWSTTLHNSILTLHQ